jgi:23S rRNA (uridine2552-2'-O)-methyltransferase
MKYFSHPLLDSFQKKVLQPCFRRVQIVKPRASRADSAEAYWLCRGFKGSSSVTGTASSRLRLMIADRWTYF